MYPALYRLGYHLLQIYWFIVRPKTEGVQCVIEYEGKYLYVKNTYGKAWWNFPGGGIGRGETKEDAIRREIREEVGITLGQMTFFGKFEHTINRKRDTVFCFYALVSTDEVVRDGKEIAEAKWFPKTQLPEQHISSVERMLLLLNEEQLSGN